MDPDAVEAFNAYIGARIHKPFFANARTVRNAIDQARMRSAIRLFNEKTAPGNSGECNEEELQTITAADIPTLAELEAEFGESDQMPDGQVQPAVQAPQAPKAPQAPQAPQQYNQPYAFPPLAITDPGK